MAGRRKPTHEEMVVLELSSIKAAINNLSNNVGKWLAAVAKAAANPADNSAEVQKVIDDLTADINATSDEVEAELNQQTKENEDAS